MFNSSKLGILYFKKIDSSQTTIFSNPPWFSEDYFEIQESRTNFITLHKKKYYEGKKHTV